MPVEPGKPEEFRAIVKTTGVPCRTALSGIRYRAPVSRRIWRHTRFSVSVCSMKRRPVIFCQCLDIRAWFDAVRHLARLLCRNMEPEFQFRPAAALRLCFCRSGCCQGAHRSPDFEYMYHEFRMFVICPSVFMAAHNRLLPDHKAQVIGAVIGHGNPARVLLPDHKAQVIGAPDWECMPQATLVAEAFGHRIRNALPQAGRVPDDWFPGSDSSARNPGDPVHRSALQGRERTRHYA